MNLLDIIDRSPVLGFVSNAVEKRIVDARRGKS